MASNRSTPNIPRLDRVKVPVNKTNDDKKQITKIDINIEQATDQEILWRAWHERGCKEVKNILVKYGNSAHSVCTNILQSGSETVLLPLRRTRKSTRGKQVTSQLKLGVMAYPAFKTECKTLKRGNLGIWNAPSLS